MPGKGHRIASKQARLGQRRRRHGKGPSTPPPPAPVAQAERTEERMPPPAPPAAAIPRPAPRPRTEYRTAVFNYIGPELKRIAIVGGVALAVLIILSVVLS